MKSCLNLPANIQLGYRENKTNEKLKKLHIHKFLLYNFNIPMYKASEDCSD